MCLLSADPHTLGRQFSLVNREDLQKVFRVAAFKNEADHQVRAAHKILGYTPIQKSFAAPKHVIRVKDPQLQRITVTKDGFQFPKDPSAPEGITLAGPSSSHIFPEATEENLEKEEEVADFGPAEDDFDVFEQVHQSEDPSRDLGDPRLTEVDFLTSESSSRLVMGYKKKSQPSLLNLIEGQPGKSQPKLPSPPPSKTLPAQTRSASAQSRLPHAPPQKNLLPRHDPVDPKQKKDKGKRPIEDKSGPTREGDNTRRPSK
nr:hypothetical protein CFP56_52611 [Quercus suber]